MGGPGGSLDGCLMFWQMTPWGFFSNMGGPGGCHWLAAGTQRLSVKDVLGPELACRKELLQQLSSATPYLSDNPLLQRNSSLWQAYPVSISNNGMGVRLPAGGEHLCISAM